MRNWLYTYFSKLLIVKVQKYNFIILSNVQSYFDFIAFVTTFCCNSVYMLLFPINPFLCVRCVVFLSTLLQSECGTLRDRLSKHHQQMRCRERSFLWQHIWKPWFTQRCQRGDSRQNCPPRLIEWKNEITQNNGSRIWDLKTSCVMFICVKESYFFLYY